MSMSKEIFQPTEGDGRERTQADKDYQEGELAVLFDSYPVLDQKHGNLNKYIVVKGGKPYSRSVKQGLDRTGDPRISMSEHDHETTIENALEKFIKREEELKKRLEVLNKELLKIQEAREILSKSE